MAKAKRGPALFELLGEEGSRAGEVKVPSWWSRPTQLTDLHSARAARAAHAADESPTDFEEPSRSAVDRDSDSPLFEVEGDRVRVSLTSVTAGVALFLGLAIVLAAYGLGSRRGEAGGFRRGFDAGRADGSGVPTDEIAALRNQPPASHLVDSLLKEQPATPPSGTVVRQDRPTTKTVAPAGADSAVGWVRNLTYIVVQEFPTANLEKARHARDFLGQRGVNTELVPLNKDTTMLITTQGYSHGDPAQKRLAEQLMEKIRAIGAQFFAAGGGYKLEGYFKTLKNDNW